MDTPVRQLVVHCPDWPVVAAAVSTGPAPDAPLAVVQGHTVIAVSPAATAAGVRRGIRRREAQARCPALLIAEADAARDGREFEPVVRALLDLVPGCEVAEPGTALFATRGPSRRCGGDDALAARALQLVRDALGARAAFLAGVGVGVADGRFAATIAAQRSVLTGTPVVIAAGRAATAAALAAVPPRSLHDVAAVPSDLVDLLSRLGLTNLGALAALDPADVLARFGHQGAFAHRLANGVDARPPGTVAPPPELAVQVTFDDPVTLLGPLVFSAKQLAESLHAQLALLGQTCTRLVVVAESEHGERSERHWHRAAGLSAAAMVERVRWQLEGWVDEPGAVTGGVHLLALLPQEAVADTGRQLGFWGESTQADEQAQRAVARLVGMLGPEAVTVAEWQGGRGPAERYRWVPAVGADLGDLAARRAALAVPAQHPWPGTIAAPSPAWVAPAPESLEVLDAHGAAVTVDGRGGLSAEPTRLRYAGTEAALTAWAGPWPVEERWWDPQRHRRRARFQVLTENGEALLVYRERGAWWLEARYD